MKEKEKRGQENSSRRNFLKKMGIGVSVAGVAGASIFAGSNNKNRAKQ